MKIKLQNLLKHNWRALLLLLTLITTSQEVLGYSDVYIGGNWGSNGAWEWTQIDNVDHITKNLAVGTYQVQASRNDCHCFCNGGSISGTTTVRFYHYDSNYQTLTLNVSRAGTYKIKLESYSGDDPNISFTYPSAPVIAIDSDGWTEREIDDSYTCNFNSTGNKQFYVKNGDGTYYKNVAFTRCDNSKTLTSDDTSNATVDVDLAGNYTFTWNSSTHLLTISYPTDGCHPDCSDMINIVNGTNVMFYFLTYGDKGWNTGSVGITNGDKSLIGTSNRIGDTYYGYVTMPSGSVPSSVYVTNNRSDWEGRKCAEGQTSASAAGALYVGNTDPGSKTDATSITVTPSASSIPTGTSSITLTSRASSTNSSKGNTLKSIVYVCNSDKSVCNQAAGSCQNVSTTNYNYTLSTSSLAAGTYKIVTILTDGTVHYIGDEFTLTVSACPKPSVSFVSPVTSVCSGTTQSYTALGETASGTIDSYTWGVSGTGWSRNDSSTSATAEFNTGTGTGTITVTATNSCGSESDAASQTVTIKGTPSTPSFSSGATKLCENVSENSYVITGTADAFIWENNSNGISWHSTPASSDKTVKVDVASSITDEATTYVRVMAQNCGSLNSAYATRNITLYKSASAGSVDLTKSTVCVNESGITASRAETWYSGGGTYEWSTTSGTGTASIDSETGAITALTAGTVTVKCTIDDPACGSTANSSAALTIKSTPIFSITPATPSGTAWKPISLSTSPSQAGAEWSITTNHSDAADVSSVGYLSTDEGSSTVFKGPAPASSGTNTFVVQATVTDGSSNCTTTVSKNVNVDYESCE